MNTLSSVSTIGNIGQMKPENLKEWREKMGLTQKELAEKLKVAPNTVSRWELNERKIPEFLELALRSVEQDLKKSN